MSETSRVSATALVRTIGVPADEEAGPAYRLVAERIRTAVLDGRLAVSTRLPSERDLAAGMGLSRTTVGAAYGLLREQGWLVSRQGAASTLRLPSGMAAATGHTGAGGIFGRPADGSAGEPADAVDLTTACLPAPEEPLAAAVAVAVRELPRYTGGDGYLPFGLPPLREAIAAKYTAAGVPTGPDQILVTSGAQHAFTLVVGELSAPGDRVLVECPTYPVALDALRAGRRVPAPIGLADPSRSSENEYGAWDVELITATVRQIAPRLGYLIPDYQNPTGALMDAGAREALVDAARAGRTVLVVDESFRDLPFPGEPALPPPVCAFDGGGGGTRVITVGSMSKSFWGGLRVGWIRASAPLIQRLAAARALGDMSGPVLDQLVGHALLADPEPALTVQRARLAEGAAALREAIARHLPDWRVGDPRGGASLWTRLPGPFATDLALRASAAGVRIAPGPRFGPDGTMESHLRLPYTSPPDRLREGMSRLAQVAGQAADAEPVSAARLVRLSRAGRSRVVQQPHPALRKGIAAGRGDDAGPVPPSPRSAVRKLIMAMFTRHADETASPA